MVIDDPLVDVVRKNIIENNLIRKGDTVLLGVSGGADSMAMLYLCASLRHVIGFKMMAVHLNHGLRVDAKRDQALVKETCQRINVPFRTKTLPLQKSKPKSMEDYARQKRLAYFKEVMKKTKARGVLLAHHRDDVAETLLLKLIGGAGLAGMRGILPRREVDGVCLLRPLLTVSRNELMLFVRQHDIPYCHDETNDDVDIKRNRVRHNLMPFLNEQFDMDSAAILARNATLMGDDYDYLAGVAEKQFQKACIRAGKKEVRLKKTALFAMPNALQRLVLRQAFDVLAGDRKRSWSGETLRAIESVLASTQKGFSRALTRGFSVKNAANGVLVFFVTE